MRRAARWLLYPRRAERLAGGSRLAGGASSGWASATDRHIYLRGAWVTDLRPSEDDLLANMMTTWRQNIRAGARKGLTVRLGSGEAELDAFYRLLVETGARDQFYVYPQDLFRDMLANYSAERAARDATAQMALLLAEHDGEPIAASTVAILGNWSLESAQRLIGPDRASQAAPELPAAVGVHALGQGARRASYYDWRTIPDVLEPGEELYGVYEFKRGFGGAVRRVMPTQDLALRPALYWPYVRSRLAAARATKTQARQIREAAAGKADRRRRAHLQAETTNGKMTDDTKAGAQ